jgi:RNA polymerase primary sigma factor
MKEIIKNDTGTITGDSDRYSIALVKYLEEVEKEGLIDAEREAILSKKIKEGDQVALNELIKANLRFVITVAKQYQNCGLSLPDLINEGNEGLIIAARRFDASRGFKFISYALWWIRNKIVNALAGKSRIIRISRNQFDSEKLVRKTVEKLEQKNEGPISTSQIATVENSNKNVISLDAPIRDTESLNFLNTLPSSDESDSRLLQSDLDKNVCEGIKILPKLFRSIVCDRYGIGTNIEMSIVDLSLKYEVSTQSIKNYLDKSLLLLKKDKNFRQLSCLLE